MTQFATPTSTLSSVANGPPERRQTKLHNFLSKFESNQAPPPPLTAIPKASAAVHIQMAHEILKIGLDVGQPPLARGRTERHRVQVLQMIRRIVVVGVRHSPAGNDGSNARRCVVRWQSDRTHQFVECNQFGGFQQGDVIGATIGEACIVPRHLTASPCLRRHRMSPVAC